MDKEIISYAGNSIPVDSRRIFESLPSEERINAVFTIAIANNARKSAKLEPLNSKEILICLQSMAAGVPILCSPNPKPIRDIKKLKMPLCLLSGDNLKDAASEYIKMANENSDIKKYYNKSIEKFDKTLISLAQEPDFGLIDGKYAIPSCHPLNSFVKTIRAELNQAMYVNERASSFLYKSGEFEKEYE